MATQDGRSLKPLWWLLGVLAASLIVVFIVGLVLASRADRPTSQVRDTGYAHYRSPWESVMRKAGVEATFPGGPVDIAAVRSFGSHPFSIALTEGEVASLIAIYRRPNAGESDGMELEDVRVDFPNADIGVIEGGVLLDGTRYQARAEAPASFFGGRIVINSARAKLSVEGFSVGGRQRNRALDGLETYLNALLQAAPGLEVRNATIIEGGLLVEGDAPDRLEHPRQLPSNNSTYASR